MQRGNSTWSLAEPEPSQGSNDDEETMGASQIAEPKQNCDDEETNKKRSNPEGPGSDADKKKRVAAEGVAGSNALRPIGASQESMNDSDIEVTLQVAGDIALMIETSMLWVPPDFPDNLKDFVKNDIETLQMELARIRTLLADHKFCPFVNSAQLHDLTERFGELDAICRYAARRRPEGAQTKHAG